MPLTCGSAIRRRTSRPDADGAWSLSGRSGAALFFAYYGTAFDDEDALAFAARLVEESLEAATGVAPLERLFEGFAGVAWTLAHVDGWLLDVSDGDPNDAIDAALLEAVRSLDVHTRRVRPAGRA